MKATSLRVVVALAVALVVFFVGMRLTAIGSELGTIPAVDRPAFIAIAAGLYILTMMFLSLVWREIVCRLAKRRVPVVPAIAVFCASWLGRYVPSSLPYVAGKIVMGRRLGLSAGALAASVLYENVIVVCIGLCGSCMLLPLLLTEGVGPAVYVVSAVVGSAGLLVLAPRVLERVLRLGARLARRAVPEDLTLLSSRDVGVVSLIVVATLALNGAAFAIILAAFTELTLREALASAVIYNFAGLVGILVLPVPSGLGVREAVLIGLLQVFVPVPVAAAAAVLVRLIGLCVDLLLGVLGAGVVARTGRRHAAADTPLEARRLDLAS